MKITSRLWWIGWLATFLALPIGGALAKVLVGSVDAPLSGLLAGGVAGCVIGIGQWLVLRAELPGRPLWVGATAVGLAAGLAAGASLVGFRTGTADLVVMGAFSGLGVGVLQAVALGKRVRGAWRWALLNPPLWALSWLISIGIGVDVSLRWAVFGASGAIFYTVVAGLLLRLLLAERPLIAATGGTR
jgi:hypothetical protein